MGGFRSPLFILGIGAAAVTTQGGVRSMLAPWAGGASGAAVTTQGGVRSMLAPWVGGATAAVSSTQGGCRSLTAFWMGGGCAGAAVAAEVPVTSSGRGSAGAGRPSDYDGDFFDLIPILAIAWQQN